MYAVDGRVHGTAAPRRARLQTLNYRDAQLDAHWPRVEQAAITQKGHSDGENDK